MSRAKRQRRKTSQGGWGLALNLLAGAGIAAGQAPLGAWYIAFPSLVWALSRMARPDSSVRSAAFAGWMVGTGYFVCALSWIVSPFLIEPEKYGWMAPFALVALALGLALFWALAAGLARLFARPVYALGGLLAAAELARSIIFTGFPWALIGHIWSDTPIAQSVSLIGASGLSVLSVLCAAMAVRARFAGWLATGVIFCAALLFGVLRPDWLPPPAPREASLRLVQPAIAQNLKWQSAQAQRNFELLLDLTAAPRPEGAPLPSLTIWPESALTYSLEEAPWLANIISEAALGPRIAFGLQRFSAQGGVYNSFQVLNSDGRIEASYDKFRLVPFGEYIPAGDILYERFGIGAFAAQLGGYFSAGPGARVLDLGPKLGLVQPLICYEAIFAYIPRAAPTRPDWMLQITNDAWFGTINGPFQHFAQVRLRAIEMGIPLVRVANGGVTAVIDAYGRVLQALPFGVTGVLDVPHIPGALSPTLFARWGDAPAFILCILVLFNSLRREKYD